MGNVQSRQRYYEVATEATHNARELQHDIGGPRIHGAILAYIEDRISAEHMMRTCTQLEANEFQRLAETAYFRWIHRNAHLFRCQPRRGRCRYPGDNIHSGLCEYYEPLPPDIDVNDAAYIQDRARYDDLGVAIHGCDYRLADGLYGDLAYDSDGYSDESSDSYSDEESEYSDSGYGHEHVGYREPRSRGNSHDDDSLDRIFTRMSDMRLGGDESSRRFGRNAFIDNESFFSDNTYADGFLPLSANRARSIHHPGRTSGRNGRGGALAGRESRGHDAVPRAVATPIVDRGATATRGGRQAITRSPPLTIGRRGATSLEGRSEGTRPSPSRGRGGMNSRGGSRGGHSHATHTARPRSPVAHDQSRENIPNPSPGRGGMALGGRGGMSLPGQGGMGLPGYGGMGLPGYGDMALPGRGGMALGGRGGMISHGRSQGGNRHATHTTGPQAPTARDESQETRPNPSTGRGGMAFGGMALGGRGGMIIHGRWRGGNRSTTHITESRPPIARNDPQEDPPATNSTSRGRGAHRGGSRIPTTASTGRNATTWPTKLPTRSNYGGSRGGLARDDGSSDAAGVVASEQGGSHQRAHSTNTAEQPLEAHNTEDIVQAPPEAVSQPAARSHRFGSEGPSRTDNSSGTGEGTSGADTLANRHSSGANAPLAVSEDGEESDSVLVCTPPASPQEGRHLQSVFESDSDDEYEIVEEGINGGRS